MAESAREVAERLRGAMDAASDSMGAALVELNTALYPDGPGLDPGAFMMGLNAAAFVMQQIDMVDFAKTKAGRRLLLEYVERARS